MLANRTLFRTVLGVVGFVYGSILGYRVDYDSCLESHKNTLVTGYNIPMKKEPKFTKIDIHLEINPENALVYGCEWYQDVIYDEEAPAEAMQDLIDAIASGEYLLGVSASTEPYFYGLYKIISKP